MSDGRGSVESHLQTIRALRRLGVDLVVQSPLMEHVYLTDELAIRLMECDLDTFFAEYHRVKIDIFIYFLREWDGMCTGQNRRGKPCGNPVRSILTDMDLNMFVRGVDDRCEHHRGRP